LNNKIFTQIRLLARKDGILGYAIRLAYAFFGNAYAQIFITIFFPVLISFYLSAIVSGNAQVIDPSNESADLSNYWRGMVVCVLLYLFFEILIFLANRHKRAKMNDAKWFQSTLISLSSANALFANFLYKFTNRFMSQKEKNNLLPLETVKDLVGFQKIAFAVCSSVYDLLKNDFKCERPQVTVFQKFTNKNKKEIQMVAYATLNDIIPSSYSESYPLTDNNQRYDAKIFNSKESQVRILHNKVAIKENFKISEHSKERQEAICQYIGIPIKNSSGETVFLLQIDVSEENILGKSVEALKELAENVFLPFAQLLYVIFEHERALENLHISLENGLANNSSVKGK